MANSSHSNWQLQDAKARFSELVKRAREQGPQHVSVRGEPAVVVVSEEEFARLTSPRPSIVDHIPGAPWPNDVVDAINAGSPDTVHTKIIVARNVDDFSDNRSRSSILGIGRDMDASCAR